MREEYEIILITEEGRAIKNNKTGKIYHSEFEIIEEKNKEIDRLNNIINYIWQVFENGGFEDGCDCIKIYDYLKALKEDK